MTSDGKAEDARADIEAKVLALLQEQSDRPLSLDSSVTADTGLDSVSVMDAVLELEDAFDVTIPLDRLADVTSIRDLVAVVEGLIAVERARGSAQGAA